MKRSKKLAVGLILGALAIQAQTVVGTLASGGGGGSVTPITGELWVAKNGSDANTGSIAAPYLTIAAAITAASSGTAITIGPGTYTENITLKAGVPLQCATVRSCFITGNMTANFSGTVYLYGIDLQASSGDVLTFSGANATNLQMVGVHIDSQSGAGHAINHTNTNAASKLLADDGAYNVAVSGASARVFQSAASSAGSVIWEDISARILDNKNNVSIAVAGALAFTHTLDDVHGQITVANTATYTGTFVTIETTSVAVLATSSSGISLLNSVACVSTANPAVTGVGGFAYFAVGFPSTCEGFQSTLNGGAGASPIPISPIQLHPRPVTTAPFDGTLEYTGTHLYYTIGAARYQLDQQTGTPAGSSGNIQYNNSGAFGGRAPSGTGTTVVTTTGTQTSGNCVSIDANGNHVPAGYACPSTAGALVLVEQHTASASATLDFTTCFSSTYDNYVLYFDRIIPATNAQDFLVRYSTNGGSTYDSSSVYAFTHADVWINSSSLGGASGNTSIVVFGSASSTTTYSINGSLNLFAVNSTTAYKAHQSLVSGYHTGVSNYLTTTIGGFYNSASVVNAARFYFASGNIASGTIRCYGVAK